MTIDIQQGDVSLFQTDDDGDVSVVGGVMQMGGGLDTMAYLCLFGGNEDDSGLGDSPFNWWGNIDEVNPAAHYRSETQHLLQSLPVTSGNLQIVQDAAGRDLNVFITEGIASSVSIEASIPARNRIKLVIAINAEGGEQTFEFTENWRAGL